MWSDSAPLNPRAVREYAGKTVLVVGAARSGLAAAELLLALGARVILNDSKPANELGTMPAALGSQHCELRLGEPAMPLLARADALLISPGISIESPLVQAAMEKGMPVLGEMSFAASCALQDILAVSGTNGKTTTVSLLGEILAQAGRVAHVAGNIGYPLSSAVLHAKRDDVLVAEVSSFQMETAAGFHPRVAALLNITPDHLDRHHSMEAYVALKRRLFSNMGPADVAVLNHDDPLVAGMAEGLNCGVAWFSRGGTADSGAALLDGQLCWLEHGEKRVLCAAGELMIPGAHNIENALAAIAIAKQLEIPLQVIAYALRKFRGVEHRIEFVANTANVRWLNDSKGTNPDSTIKAVEAMTAPTVLIAGGYDKQVPFDLLAAVITGSGLITDVVLIGQTAGQIERALRGSGFGAVHPCGSLEEAVQLSQSLARPGGNILFSPACASFDMFHDYEQRGQVFKHLVEQLARGAG